MAEQRTDEQMMTGPEMPPSPDIGVDRPSEGLSTADLAGVGSATQATTTDVSGTETPAPPEQRLEPQSLVPAPTADQPPGPDQARPDQTKEETPTPLFAADAAESFRSRWQDIQTSFIDEPTRAVEQADSLVAEIMQQLATTFADERSHLEEQGEHGKDISTEDLRMALRHYRSFFDRLLSI
jgi:hypothetical protein